MLVMLRSNWPGDTFRRAGIEFQRGNPVDLDEAALKSVARDLGKALVLVSATTAKADHDATAEAAADLDAFLKKTPPPVAPSTDEVSPAANASEAPATTTETAAMVEPAPRRKR